MFRTFHLAVRNKYRIGIYNRASFCVKATKLMFKRRDLGHKLFFTHARLRTKRQVKVGIRN